MTSKHKNTFYLDMDGVVADWVGGVEQIVGYRIDDPTTYYPTSDWLRIRDHKRLFRHLPLMPLADTMVNLARRFRDDLGWELFFLTAVPHYNDVPWAFSDKIEWAREHYPDIPVHFGPYSKDKQKHCKPGDILVDDRPDNCEEWKRVGGIAIRVPFDNYSHALTELSKLLDKKMALSRLAVM